MNRGIWSAAGACVAWGLFPVYWKQLVHVPSLELISHRFVWSFLLLAAIIWSTGQRVASWNAVVALDRRWVLVATGLLIGVNWFTFLWAIDAGLIVEASLGYFISPLFNVALGVAVLRESLRPGQWLAIVLAVAGVLYLTFVYGSVPRVALALAVSFGLYGLLKKTAPIGASRGLAVETGALFVPALAYLLYLHAAGVGAFTRAGVGSDLLLVGSGPITVLPLLLFGSAVQRIPLSLMGVLQYIAPTLQFAMGVTVYREPFTSDQLIGFGLVWIALAVFTAERLMVSRGTSALAT